VLTPATDRLAWPLPIAFSPLDTAMFHTTPFLSNRDFRERALRDLALGRSLCAASSSAPGSAPVVGQLAGNDAPALVEAGKLLGGLVDALELNLGCPQQRAKEGHYGAYLLAKKDLPLVTSLVSALTTLAVPAHVKYRLPPSPASASEYACALAQAGARTLTLHARPAGSPSRRRDLYGLRVPAIGETRKALNGEGWGEVRLVGNGGVRERADVDRLRDEAGVEGWMVGEHLAGNHRYVRRIPSTSVPASRGDSRTNIHALLHCSFFDSTQAGARALELADEYLTLVETCPSDLVPLQSVQRHVRNFVEGDLLSCVLPVLLLLLKFTHADVGSDDFVARRQCSHPRPQDLSPKSRSLRRPCCSPGALRKRDDRRSLGAGCVGRRVG
jgi:tRNA-dihydrouridine synthase